MNNPFTARKRAFTLVEIMIVVAIIALLATIAVPSWLRARMRTQNAKYLNDIRIYSQAVDTYAVDNKFYPPDLPPGALTPTPAGMTPFADYVKDKNHWTSPTVIGGLWDLNNLTTGPIVASVGALDYTINAGQLDMLEKMGDDGDTATGPLQVVGTGYYYIIEARDP